MTPIELIKQGIDKRDWTDVCKGYNILSGEQIMVVTGGTPDDRLTELAAAIHKAFVKVGLAIPQLPAATLASVPQPTPPADTTEEEEKEDEVEPVVNPVEVQAQSKTPYGDAVRFVTHEETDPVKKAKLKAKKPPPEVPPRPAPPVFQATCNKCGSTFESPTKPSQAIGQNCTACMRALKRD